MEQETLVFEGATLVLPDRLIEGRLVLVEGKIKGVGDVPTSKGSTRYQVPRLYIAPGFIDLQVNGGVGHNFSDVDPEGMRKATEFHLRHGSTGLLATLITAPIERIRRALEVARAVDVSNVLGIHLEGPFISPKRKGAHNPAHILKPSLSAFQELVSGYEDFMRIVTLAPELPGAGELIGRIREGGAVPALGHSDASYEQALAALEQGVKLFTHLFNAMPPFHHRAPGAVGAALDSDAYVGLICDEVHVHPAVVRLVAKIKGYDRICLVSDAISAAGLPDGEYSLGGLPVFVKEGVARLSDGTLAGSTLTMDRAVRNFLEFTGCSLPEAVRCAALNPARLLGIDDRKGSLAVGKDADLVIFDADLTVHYTVLGGKVVYAKP